MNGPRIAVVTAWDARTPAYGSGISHYMGRALERNGCEVAYLGPAFSWFQFGGKVVNRAQSLLGLKERPYIHGRAMSREFGRIFGERIPADADFILAPMAGTQIAFLDTPVPLLYTSDTTFALLADYYPEFTGLSERYRAEASEIEHRAISRSRILAYPSEWAAESAITEYGADRRRVHVVPWGANLDEVPSFENIIAAKSNHGCRLLFIGKDWERKGGPLAYRVVLDLRRRGVDAHLTIVGCEPAEHLDSAAATVAGPIDKAIPGQRAALTRLLLEAHFLLQPSRHESLGVVYCEASAHGTPSIATETGGIGGVVFQGENGFRLPESAAAADYAELILNVLSDRAGYQKLVETTWETFQTRLNWDAWAHRMKELMFGAD